MKKEDNLKMFTSAQNREEAAKNGKKGGKASGEARREKRTVQKMLTDLIDSNVNSLPQLAKLADKMGIKRDESIKYIFTVVCLLNSIKKGTLDDLEHLTRLIGEDADLINVEDMSEVEKKIWGDGEEPVDYDAED